MPDDLRPPPSEREEFDGLWKSIRGAVEQYLTNQRGDSRPEPARTIDYLDFSRNELSRHGQPAIPLAAALWVRMVEDFCRQSAMSLRRFLLLPRSKPSTSGIDVQNPSRALRHELAQLRRRIREMNFPITIVRHDLRLRAVFEHALDTNIFAARARAQAAYEAYRQRAYQAASQEAAAALAIDYDSGLAAWVVVQLAKIFPDGIGTDLVGRTETCIARLTLKYAAALQRLPRGRGMRHAEVAKAWKIARRMLKRTRRHWYTLGAWPFGDSPSDRSADSPRNAFRELVDVLAHARCGGGTAAYSSFAENSIVAEVVDRLVSTPRDPEVKHNLRIELFAKLVLHSWSPLPASSAQQVRDQILRFVRSRRIDLSKVTNRTSVRTVVFRDGLHRGSKRRRRAADQDDDGDHETTDEDRIDGDAA